MRQPVRHLWRAGALVALALALYALHTAPAAPYAPDGVDDLRQALRTQIRDSTNKDELQYRGALLEKRAKALTVGELRRALMLIEWRDEDRDEAIAAIDRPIREGIVNRLIDSLRGNKEKKVVGILEGKSTAAKLAAIAQISEMGVTLRGVGTRSGLASVFAKDLAEQMKSSSPAVQQAAAKAMGKINPDPKIATQALGELLTSSNVADRRAAADGLSILLQTVITLTRGKNVTSGVEVSRPEVAAMCQSVVPVAGRGLGDNDITVRRSCLEAVHLAASILYDSVLDPPRQEFPPPDRRPSADERADIMAYQRQVGEERRTLLPVAVALDNVSAPVTRATADPVPPIRLLACQTLEEMGQARNRLLRKAGSVPQLEPSKEKEKEKDKEEARRRDAALLRVAHRVAQEEKKEPEADELKSDPLKPGLLKAMPILATRAVSDPIPRIRLASLDALETLGPLAAPIVRVISASLTDCNQFVRWAASRVFMKIGPTDTDLIVPLLARLIDDPDLDVEMAAAQTLGTFGADAKLAVPTLTAAISAGDSERRVAVIHALQAIGEDSAPAIPALTAALRDGDARVRRAAAEGLGSLGALAKSAVPALEKVLDDPDETVRKASSDALLAIVTAGKKE